MQICRCTRVVRLLLLVIAICVNTTLFSQDLVDRKIDLMVPSDSLPEKIRSGKSLVLIDLVSDNPSEWDRVSRAFHNIIVKGGIDPVVYYSLSTIFSGTEVTRSFIEDFGNRELDNIILLKYRGENSFVGVMSFEESFFTDKPVSAWTREGEFKNIADQLYVRTANSGYELANFLTAEIPEKGVLTQPIKGRRAEFFNLSLSSGKLAVPKFNDPLKDQELQAVFDMAYPYEFELVDPSFTDVEIANQGFRFILRYVTGPASLVRELLDYEEEEGITGYVTLRYKGENSEALTLSQSEKVYKFYINHFQSNTTYLGTEWDADLGWRQSLLNHLWSIEKWVNN